MIVCRNHLLIFFLALFMLVPSLADSRTSMIVGVEENRLRCSGGSELNWKVGDQVVISRGDQIIGRAEVQQIGDYQTWISLNGQEAQVGDKVGKTTPEKSKEQFVTRGVTFKVKLDGGGGGGGAANGLFGLLNIYNLVDNQRFARDFGDGFYRTSADVDLAIGVASFLFGQFNRRRGPKIAPAEARFDLAIDRRFLKQEVAAVELNLAIENTGAHELQFGELGQHLFLKDRNGTSVEYFEMSGELLEPLQPGERVEGLVRFPEAELGKRIRFRFEDILGKDKTVKF